ncbi:hypothetical protein TSAR_010269 [Trichomalopsis sarcophagae]|uniref:Bee-milk protein n=1 Tax=Trichomalopsis sarcophagae TaxID=543379 RepID=A0A232ELL8_9HYME|nr:hypothetical protein TSAR_010269 [Trichomalopsis sarcophagae]
MVLHVHQNKKVPLITARQESSVSPLILQRNVYAAVTMILLVVSIALILQASAAFPYRYANDDTEILVAATDGVYRTSLDGFDTFLVAKAVNATGVDYHYDKHLVFWSDVATHRIYSKDLFNESSEIKTVVAGPNDWEPRAIAVDYVNDKIYAMDQRGRKIDVFELDGSKRISGIQVNLTDPEVDDGDTLDVGPSTMDIVVDPYEGFVFYGDHNKVIKRVYDRLLVDNFQAISHQRVMRATMDFTSVECVGQKARISGLAVDPYVKSFYYADAQHVLWETNYKGERKFRFNIYEDEQGSLLGRFMAPRSLSKYNYREFFWLEDLVEQGYPSLFHLWFYRSPQAESVYTDMKSGWTIRVRPSSVPKSRIVSVKVLSWFLHLRREQWRYRLLKINLFFQDYAKGCEKADCEYMCLVSNAMYSSVTHSCFDEA